MDPLTVCGVALIGAVLGLATGLVPGLHVNTLAAVGITVAPAAGATGAILLVATGVAHTFVSILPATYLGAPGEDTALSVLPAHRMLHAGRGPEAIHLSVHASLLGLLGAVTLFLPLRWVLGEPGHGLAFLDTVAPWLLGATILALLMQEPRGRRGTAVLVAALAGWLGVLAFAWPVRALVPVPATPLLPLLAGLFAVPTLLASLRSHTTLPAQAPMPRWSARPSVGNRDVLPGIAVSATTAVLPGLTGAVATSIARVGRRTHEPASVLATLSTVNTTHAILAVGMLWLVGRTRSGLAQAVEALAPAAAWVPGPPPPLFGAIVQTVLVAGSVGAVGTLWLERPVRCGLQRLPSCVPPALGLGIVVALVVVLGGAAGSALLGVAAVVGTVPLVVGVRRVHLVAALLVPILIRLVG